MNNQELETGLIGGIEKRELKIVDYDSAWIGQYQKHACIIKDALGDGAERIEHIGSTSVPQLGAKPIIDVLLVVKDSANEAAYLPSMLAAGYHLRVREPDFHEHRMFRTPELDAHIHVFSVGCIEIHRYLIFRDRLRTDANARRAYEDLKRQLLASGFTDMNAYANAKTEFIASILHDASSSLRS